MKKVLANIGLITSLTISQLSAGEAIIPFWNNNNVWTSCYSISNVTGSDIMFKVELYDYTGQIYTNSLKWNTNISDLNTNTSLESNKSAFFCLAPSSSNSFGYGRIITSDLSGTSAKGLVIASGFGYNFPKDERSVQILINNGLPF